MDTVIKLEEKLREVLAEYNKAAKEVCDYMYDSYELIRAGDLEVMKEDLAYIRENGDDGLSWSSSMGYRC